MLEPINPKSELAVRRALQDFYKDWLIWASEGGKNIRPFSKYDALCAALRDWAFHHEYGYEFSVAMKNHMKSDFESEGLSRTYPFGEDDYDERWMNGTMHKCPKRFDFVYRMAKRNI